ncbi:MAG: aromatic acid exporter family protein [Firmicutes bacterium]|nr:aromatic acid exporter family protein [Bacillota bacterium]
MAVKFHVGGRVLKTSLAVGLSVFVVQSLEFGDVTLAAIVAVVTIQRTFYRSLLQSAERLGSVLLGTMLGTLLALILGATPLSYSLVTLVVILACLRLNWQENVVVVTVVAIGVMASPAENLPLYSFEQFVSALIGAVVALGVNFMFAPSHQNAVLVKLASLEILLQQMMSLVAEEILRIESRYEDLEQKAENMMQEINLSLELSKLFREEQRFSILGEKLADEYQETFRYYATQSERLLEMHYLAKHMISDMPQAAPIARLLCILKQVQSRRLRGKNAHDRLLTRIIENLDASFEEMEMPKNRAEFLTRSALVHLYQEIKRYYQRTKRLPQVLANNDKLTIV